MTENTAERSIMASSNKGGYYAMGADRSSSGSDRPAEPMSGINEEMAQIHEALSYLTLQVDNMAGRLDVVLEPEAASLAGGLGNSSPEKPHSPLYHELRSVRHQISARANSISNMLARLEI